MIVRDGWRSGRSLEKLVSELKRGIMIAREVELPLLVVGGEQNYNVDGSIS